MREFKTLDQLEEDGTVPLSILIDLAIYGVYGDIDLDSFVDCHYETDSEGNITSWIFAVRSSDTDTLKLIIGSDYAISFWCNGMPLHFNQAPLYAKLYEWNFIEVCK